MFQNVVNCKREGIEQLRYQGLVLGAGCWRKAPNRGGIQDILRWQKKVDPEVEILVLDFLQKHLWVGRCLVTEYGPEGPGCSGSSGARRPASARAHPLCSVCPRKATSLPWASLSCSLTGHQLCLHPGSTVRAGESGYDLSLLSCTGPPPMQTGPRTLTKPTSVNPPASATSPP